MQWSTWFKNSEKKSDFLLLYGSYRIIRKLNPAFDPHQRLKLRSKSFGDRCAVCDAVFLFSA